MKPCYSIELTGRTRRSVNNQWTNTRCVVAYGDHKKHLDIVEASFRDHLGLDLEYVRGHHSNHFSEPHNVARAIALYHYFRQNHIFWDEDSSRILEPNELPARDPDVSGRDFRLWVDTDT